MLAIILNQKGNLSIAMVVLLIAVLSGLSMSMIAFQDSLNFRGQLEAIQQYHLIRSEMGRGFRFYAVHSEENNPVYPVFLPIRFIKVEFDGMKTYYRARTRISEASDSFNSFTNVGSLMYSSRKNHFSLNRRFDSPIVKYGEMQAGSLKSLAGIHLFTEINEDLSGMPMGRSFSTDDVIYGRIHVNGDLILSAGSLPIFYGLVTASGTVNVEPNNTNYQREQIFRGGLIENYRELTMGRYPSSTVRRNGSWPLGRTERDDRIAYVTVEGSTYEINIFGINQELVQPGQWVEGVNQFTVYSSYPPYGPIGDSLTVNRIPRKDTVLVDRIGGSISHSSAFIPMQMWISGTFGSRQTWASSHDIYLKDDLLYQRTARGRSPDGIDSNGNPNQPVNSSDYLGIISERSIIIQYGHFHPIDTVRVKPNTNDIYLYGAFCAAGIGEKPWEDGVFTYQYQFPKGSTPPQMYEGVNYKNIDLHRFSYPTTSLHPWPPGLDYPWYNPLWPEPGQIYGFAGFPKTPNPHNAPTITKLRGRIHLYGSLAQRRQGYTRRSGNADFDTGIWDIENMIQPTTPPRYGSPAPSIGHTGYDKAYYPDRRFFNQGPPHFPPLNDLVFQYSGNPIFKRPPLDF